MHCISISHKTTPVKIRELFAFSTEEQIEFQKKVVDKQIVNACIIVSTCNRSEIYFSGDKRSIGKMEEELASYKKIDELLNYVNVYSNLGTVKHLFRVCCGLDSMVIGEDEILHQIKEAYELSLHNQCTDHQLNIIFQGAIGAAKAIKTDTIISTTPTSIGTLTANKVVEFLTNEGASNVLIVGATGKMGRIIAKNLGCKGDLNIIGTSRNHCGDHDIIINDHRLQVVDYKQRYEYLESADVIVSATTSPHYTFTYRKVVEQLKDKGKKKLFIDLAVPCDIDKEIAMIDGYELLDIDFFQQASKENNKIKLRELDKVELILEHKIDETMKAMYFQKFQPRMQEVNEKIAKVGINSVLYHFKKSLNSEQLKAVLEALEVMEYE